MCVILLDSEPKAMLLVEYHKKYYILRGFSTTLMLCNTLQKLNKVGVKQRSGGFASISDANSMEWQQHWSCG